MRFLDIWSLTLFSDDVDSQCWSDYEDMAQALKYVKTLYLQINPIRHHKIHAAGGKFGLYKMMPKT